MLLPTAKLPRFMDYLYQHYSNLYQLYSGRLIELFPCFDDSVNNLAIAEDQESTEEEDSYLIRLWKQFQ